MKFYFYSQNNSGGYFIGHRYVWIQANSADEANFIAENKGLYFDGLSTNGVRRDCACCGNRWYRADEADGSEEPCYYDRRLVFDARDGMATLVNDHSDRGDTGIVFLLYGQEVLVKVLRNRVRKVLECSP